MSIKIGSYDFEGPFLAPSDLRDRSGVYVILSEKLGRYSVIDVGESAQVRTRVEQHDRKDCWEKHRTGPLRYCARYEPEADRMRTEQRLREQYDPPCGER